MIAAGIGGIATAGRLARDGYQLAVLEEIAAPGGRCGRISTGGHRFDPGLTLFLTPGVREETLSACRPPA